MKLLLIEDEEGVIRFVSKGLKEEGFSIDSATSAEIALKQVEKEKYDLLILDLFLPQMNGFEFLSVYRQKNKEVPVLVLTVKDSISDKRNAFLKECDDYLTKPFHFDELLLRIRALLRRYKKDFATILEIGTLRLETETFQVFVKQQRIWLTKKEFALLHYFMLNTEKLLSRTQILNEVWKGSWDVGVNIVDVTINTLRKKIQHPENSHKIVSVYGMGYAFQKDSEK